MSRGVVDQLVVENRSASRRSSVVPPSQHVPSACTRAVDVVRHLVGVAEPHHHLVQDDVVEDLDAVARPPSARRTGARVRAAAVDQLGDAAAPSSAIAAHTAKPRARRDDSGT